MQITSPDQLKDLEDNTFLGNPPEFINSQINFNGKNNILFCEENVKLFNSRIDFNLENSILYLSSNQHHYAINVSLHKDNACFIGKNNFFNGLTTIVLSEAKNFIMGNDCFISYNVIIRVSDGHAIYNTRSKKRMNFSKSIYIGDHVWLGQNAMIFKGTHLGSGSIIGAGSIVSNKIIPSNTTYAGSPARLVSEDTFWTPHSVHGWGDDEIRKMSKSKSDLFVFEHDESTLNMDDIEDKINKKDAMSVLEFFKSDLQNDDKNRFFIGEYSRNEKKGKFRIW